MKRIIPSVLLLVMMSIPAMAAFPPVPGEAIVEDIQDGLNRATFYIWAQDGSLYLHVDVKTQRFVLVGFNFFIIQGKEQFDPLSLIDERGLSFSGFLYRDQTFRFEAWEEPQFDATKPLVLRYTPPDPDLSWDITPIDTHKPVGVGLDVTDTSRFFLINASIAAGRFNGKLSDWWLFLKKGHHFYSFIEGNWKLGTKPEPFLQTRLCDLKIKQLKAPKELPSGTYSLYFGVDLRMDGRMNNRSFKFKTREIIVE